MNSKSLSGSLTTWEGTAILQTAGAGSGRTGLSDRSNRGEGSWERRYVIGGQRRVGTSEIGTLVWVSLGHMSAMRLANWGLPMLR